jgi:hypothetical protein
MIIPGSTGLIGMQNEYFRDKMENKSFISSKKLWIYQKALSSALFGFHSTLDWGMRKDNDNVYTQFILEKKKCYVPEMVGW